MRLIILVIPHTFGRHLNFNCHLHVLVSEGGLDADGTAWRRAPLDRKALMPMWRYAVITYLRAAYRMGVLKTDLLSGSWPNCCAGSTNAGGISISNGSRVSGSSSATRAAMPAGPPT